jgi:arabinogalactan endo-1,4-beta-galactosidase
MLTAWRMFLVVVCFSHLLLSMGHARTFITGVDISAVPSLEAAGANYSDNGVPGSAIEILTQNAANYARLRLFVDPSGAEVQDQDIPYTVALAQRVKAAGMKVLLDFHYSDTWADPGTQTKPAAWQGLSFGELEQQVYDYTRDVIEQFDAAGALPDMVQIGNEINSGMIWQEGRLFRPDLTEAQEFDNLATLMSAGIDATRDAAGPGREPLIAIHHSRGDNWGQASFWLSRLLPRLQANGTDVDVIGYSYYPLHHSDNIANVQQTLNNTATTYGKPVALLETGFAWRDCQSSCEPNYPWELSKAGQQKFLHDVINAVLAVPNEMGLGVFWWYAEATPVSGIQIWQDGRYGLFDNLGGVLPAIEEYVNLPRVPGDVDDDGDVDMDDFYLIRDHLSTEVFPPGIFPRKYGDLNLDGAVDLEDFGQWKDHFLLSEGGASIVSSSSVPEPAGVTLVAIQLLSVSTWARRRRRLPMTRTQPPLSMPHDYA